MQTGQSAQLLMQFVVCLLDRVSHYFDLCVLFFTDTATTEIYTLSLHDALPISRWAPPSPTGWLRSCRSTSGSPRDRKSTRLNSSHANISYAVFCLKKKNIRTCKRVRDCLQ